MKAFSSSIRLVLLASLAACQEPVDDRPANQKVRERIEELAPAAVLGHRGLGPTRPGHAFPENSLSSLDAAMDRGAHGVELDVGLSADGQIIVMHDANLDRTTDCAGCIGDLSLAELRECRLLDADGQATAEAPPTLKEVYDLLPAPALINVELKALEGGCVRDGQTPTVLGQVAAAEVTRLGEEGRTIFSSFEAEAVEAVKLEHPEYYAAHLLIGAGTTEIERAVELELDAIHPFGVVTAEGVAEAQALGLQVNVWTVNGAEAIDANLAKGVDCIITDEPDVAISRINP